MRSLAVVLSFVVLNAIAFVAYRALATPSAAAANRQAPAATTVDTFSRAKPARQSKLDALAKDDVATPETSSPVDALPVTHPASTVSADAESPDAVQEEAQEDTPSHAGSAHHLRSTRAAHRHGDRSASRNAKPEREEPKKVEAKPPEQAGSAHDAAAHEKQKDKLLEMEANPYKRRE